MEQITKQEICTAPLNLSQILDLVDDAAECFEVWRENSVVVTFGWSYPADLIWTSQTVAVSELPRFIRNEKVGTDDLYASDAADSSWWFLFCHESDVHFRSTDQARIDCVIQRWKAKGLKLMISTVSEDVRARREWKDC